jgi:hypothetical protein
MLELGKWGVGGMGELVLDSWVVRRRLLELSLGIS